MPRTVGVNARERNFQQTLAYAMIYRMPSNSVVPPRLLALSDLHVGYPENRSIVGGLRPGSAGDWLIVAGDVGELFADIEWALGLLSVRFARVVWVPGNHELWTHGLETVPWRGVERYRRLVDMCRRLGVVTPEDPHPVWTGPGGPVTIAPLFLLYDYSFLPENAPTKEQALAYAYRTGIVCTDEAVLHPILTRAVKHGAGPGSRRPNDAWPGAIPACRQFW